MIDESKHEAIARLFPSANQIIKDITSAPITGEAQGGRVIERKSIRPVTATTASSGGTPVQTGASKKLASGTGTGSGTQIKIKKTISNAGSSGSQGKLKDV